MGLVREVAMSAGAGGGHIKNARNVRVLTPHVVTRCERMVR